MCVCMKETLFLLTQDYNWSPLLLDLLHLYSLALSTMYIHVLVFSLQCIHTYWYLVYNVYTCTGI